MWDLHSSASLRNPLLPEVTPISSQDRVYVSSGIRLLYKKQEKRKIDGNLQRHVIAPSYVNMNVWPESSLFSTDIDSLRDVGGMQNSHGPWRCIIFLKCPRLRAFSHAA